MYPDAGCLLPQKLAQGGHQHFRKEVHARDAERHSGPCRIEGVWSLKEVLKRVQVLT